MSTALVWFRRDLRLADNPALCNACERHERVVPVYIHAPDEEVPWAPGAASRWWLHHSLAALDDSLREAGAPLILRRGDSLAELLALARECSAEAVYWNRLYEPAAVARDKRNTRALREEGLHVESYNASLLFEPWQIRNGGDQPYRVFTPFWRTVNTLLRESLAVAREPLSAPQALAAPDAQPSTLPLAAFELLPKRAWDRGFYASWTPGATGAQQRLEHFCGEALAQYREAHNRPSLDASSRLSPHLHFGEISPLQCAARIERLLAGYPAARTGADSYLRELGWREFAYHQLCHFPGTVAQPQQPRFAAFPWRQPRDYADDLHAWQRGRTGIPIVDAGMRQLWQTGWMHNRVRMIAASFLTKNLLIPWQEGARWFWDTLVDADLASNTLGWQWVAGCGADAAPYFRVFNPVLQSTKFDADGAYLRRWLPELAGLPASALHAPWKAAPAQQAQVRLGIDYPQPIANLETTRRRALDAYQRTETRKKQKGPLAA